MKLYVWRPPGHGPSTFMVVAADEDAARAAVDAHVRREYMQPDGVFKYYSWGWPDDYQLEVYEPGQVCENDNQ